MSSIKQLLITQSHDLSDYLIHKINEGQSTAIMLQPKSIEETNVCPSITHISIAVEKISQYTLHNWSNRLIFCALTTRLSSLCYAGWPCLLMCSVDKNHLLSLATCPKRVARKYKLWYRKANALSDMNNFQPTLRYNDFASQILVEP